MVRGSGFRVQPARDRGQETGVRVALLACPAVPHQPEVSARDPQSLSRRERVAEGRVRAYKLRRKPTATAQATEMATPTAMATAIQPPWPISPTPSLSTAPELSCASTALATPSA